MPVTFDDGFETEVAAFTSHWSGLQQKASGRITLVTSPVANETKAARFECRVGDNNVAGSGTGERAETLKSVSGIGAGYGTEGHDDYTALSVRFEAGYPYFASNLWNTFAQWHASAGGTQACTLAVVGGKIVCVTNGGTSLSAKPFNRVVVDDTFEAGKWYDFVVKHHWSSSSGGYFDVWFQKDGVVTGPFTVNGPNIYLPDTGRPYPKIGIYRGPGIGSTAVLEYGRYAIRETFADAIAAFASWDSGSSPGTVDDGSGLDAPETTDPLSGGGVRIGVAFDDVTLEPSPVWTYLTDTDNVVAAYEIERGRQFELDRTDAGRAKVTIYDRNGLLDPTLSTGPYFGKIQPLLQIKIELWNPVAGEWHSRFRGFILEYDYVVDPSVRQLADGSTVGLTRLELDCSDLFAILSKIEMYPDLVSGDPAFGDPPPPASAGNVFFDNASAHDRIEQVLTNGLGSAFVALRCITFTLNVNVQETVYSPGENVLQVVQDAADADFPTVANSYCDRFGRFVTHGRLAKFDPAGVSADAGPSAWDWHEWKVGDGKAVGDSPSDTAQLRTFAYNLGWSKVFNYALCTPNGIDQGNKGSADRINDQISRDDTSIGQFGYCPWSAENLIIGAPADDPLTGDDADFLVGANALDACKNYADYITFNYGQPRTRITELTVRSIVPTRPGAAATWDMLGKIDISDLVDVYVRGPGDGPSAYIFNGDQFFVEGMNETAEPANGQYANVTLSLDLSPKAYYTTGAWTGD